MFNKKIALAGVMIAAFASTAYAPQSHAATTSSSVKFQMNQYSYMNNTGNHSLTVAPYALHGNVMVPLRALAESLGAGISWNQASQTATIAGQAFGQIKLKVNAKIAVNQKGEQIKLPESIKQVKGSLVVPAKSIAGLMGAKVNWSSSTRTITITQNTEVRDSITVSYNFSEGNDGWKGDFADLPVDYNKDIYELQYARELLPLGDANKTNYGLKLKGVNRSDDLFMFLTRKVDDLKPNTAYQVKLDFGMYTSESGGMMGVGGSPSEAVKVKAGVINKEPAAIQKDDGGSLYYRMNIDKGIQSESGADAKVLGDITKPDSGKEGYQRVNFSYSAAVTTNAKGDLFLLIGTDSGYEGLTTLYFDDIKLTATQK
ncbi:copper amine oxidase N-terminal domain-containing protein [Cohnella luojiensis]|uniref:Copper amine oxidase N-terminal domain-containing protein n=1 Tax=Cohnella luojiensis TaxID=652876 RepID=A0A4Y8LXD3_9BACL|nr:copper amine oxidase N-terminal domain-containing protein [Cohnella luojiensis]TFE25979.1 copper amine oxidase N-terminal domain-containing protein [Cohnella luojiensis]